jgi:foldase protein PrsA
MPVPTAPLAAVVNGDSIYLADFEKEVSAFEQALVAEGLDPDSEEGQAALEQIRHDVLESMIDVALIQQGGAELAVTLSDEEIRTQIAADVANGGGEANFEAWLAATGQTLDEYTALVAHLCMHKVMEKVGTEIPSEAEQVHVRQIIVDTDAAARDVLARVQAGADFADVARERSLDLTTAEEGGDLGWFPRGVMSPQLEEVAFSLHAGELSEPIKTDNGYNILEVVDRRHPAGTRNQMQLALPSLTNGRRIMIR